MDGTILVTVIPSTVSILIAVSVAGIKLASKIGKLEGKINGMSNRIGSNEDRISSIDSRINRVVEDEHK